MSYSVRSLEINANSRTSVSERSVVPTAPVETMLFRQKCPLGLLLDGNFPSETPLSPSSRLRPVGPAGQDHALRSTAPPSSSPLSFTWVPFGERGERRGKQGEGERRESTLNRLGRAASTRGMPPGPLCMWARCGRGCGGFLEHGMEARVSR